MLELPGHTWQNFLKRIVVVISQEKSNQGKIAPVVLVACFIDGAWNSTPLGSLNADICQGREYFLCKKGGSCVTIPEPKS
jgi:hypothetical protein